MSCRCLRGWVVANNWWERSPSLSNITNFTNVNLNGNTGNNNNASNVNGVVPCFFLVIVTTYKGEINYSSGEGEYNHQNIYIYILQILRHLI